MDLITRRIADLPGQFDVSHSYDEATGYTQVLVRLRNRPDEVFAIMDGVNDHVSVSVYDDEQARAAIARNGQEWITTETGGTP